MSRPAGPHLDRLIEIMQMLRSPEGCPWDREQTLATLRPFVLEETCELLDAIDEGDWAGICEELGDVVFEAVFIAQLCSEPGHFTLADALQSVLDKLIRRHPHVFTPDGLPLSATRDITSTGVRAQWDDIKTAERAQAGKPQKPLLGGIPRALPALLRAEKVGARAASVGFDWPDALPVLDKIDEEVAELREAVALHGLQSAAVEDEYGDVLFALTNLGRKMGLSPERALQRATDKFHRRFGQMEATARAEGRALTEESLESLEARWQAAKAATDADGHPLA
ncbi:MAG: nucleoside triphosphate pyrophosphohydrolase [Acidobacteria bacterium]|nr:nucleoside triphosphate pyrophosphohydrolase [Acidobacteriota bacterium]